MHSLCTNSSFQAARRHCPSSTRSGFQAGHARGSGKNRPQLCRPADRRHHLRLLRDRAGLPVVAHADSVSTGFAAELLIVERVARQLDPTQAVTANHAGRLCGDAAPVQKSPAHNDGLLAFGRAEGGRQTRDKASCAGRAKEPCAAIFVSAP